MKTKLFRQLAQLVDARLRCAATTGMEDAAFKHEERILQLVKNHMPSGSGIDNGTTISLEQSTGEKLVFSLGFHHMDEHGFYSGWTFHNVTVKPSLRFGLDLKISGRDKNQIKDYLYQEYEHALNQEIS